MSRTFTILIALILFMIAFIILRSYKSEPPTSEFVPSPKSDVSTASETNLQDWREFTSVTKHFKVLLPSLPQHVADKVFDAGSGEMRKYETFIAADNRGAAFMVSTILYAHNVEKEDASAESLKAAITDILSRNKGNKLNEIKPGHFHNYPALDFSITSNEMSIEGKVFAFGNTIYVLSMVDRSDVFNQQELSYFMNSFELIDENTKTPTPAPVLPKK